MWISIIHQHQQIKNGYEMHVPAEFDEQINLYVRSSAIRQNTRSSIHRAFFSAASTDIFGLALSALVYYTTV